MDRGPPPPFIICSSRFSTFGPLQRGCISFSKLAGCSKTTSSIMHLKTYLVFGVPHLVLIWFCRWHQFPKKLPSSEKIKSIKTIKKVTKQSLTCLSTSNSSLAFLLHPTQPSLSWPTTQALLEEISWGHGRHNACCCTCRGDQSQVPCSILRKSVAAQWAVSSNVEHRPPLSVSWNFHFS